MSGFFVCLKFGIIYITEGVVNMVMSMTGFGVHVINMDNTTITVEIRSVNNRFLDFTAKMPRSFFSLEDKIKKIIQSYFGRGRIEVYISVEGKGFVQKTLKTDWDIMDNYMEQVNIAKTRYQLNGDIPVAIITSIPEVISIQESIHQPDGLKESILAGTKQACEQVEAMRKEEGLFLFNDLKERMDAIYDIIIVLQTHRGHVIKEYRDRIQARINDHLDDTVTMDHARIHQEIVLLAEKGDITEEITRLFSHVELGKETLDEKGAIGRKLDFITQEMHREANTIGSKSTDVKISEWTIALKGEIEKVKEQLQNIE